MLVCTVVRTHRLGVPQRNLAGGIVGSIVLRAGHVDEYRRHVNWLDLQQLEYAPVKRSLIPALYEPQLLAFGSERGMSVAGHECIEGVRYYQSWWVRWEWEMQ